MRLPGAPGWVCGTGSRGLARAASRLVPLARRAAVRSAALDNGTVSGHSALILVGSISTQ